MNRLRGGIMQHDIRDCGAACLATILRRYDLRVPLVHIREKMKVDRNGSSIYSIIHTAKEYHLSGEGFIATGEELKQSILNDDIKLPLIAHIVTEDYMGHFIVIDEIKNDKVTGFDPAAGNFKKTMTEFCQAWTGYIIIFQRLAEFKSGNLKKGLFNKYLDILKIQKRLFTVSILLSLVLAGISVFCALAYQQIIDYHILGNGFADTMLSRYDTVYANITGEMYLLFSNINILFVALLVLFIMQAVMEFLRNFFLTKITRNSLRLLSLRYCKHFLSLPVFFFQDRETGEIMSRFNNIDEIQEILSGVACSVLLNFFMTVTGGIVLASISEELFIIVIGLTFFYVLIVLFYRKPVQKISREIMENDARVTAEMKGQIDGIETIKVFCGESWAFEKIKKKIEDYTGRIYKGNIMIASQRCILGLLESIGMIILLWSGSMLAISGRLSLGDLIAFLSLVYFFLSPVIGLIGLQPQLQQAYIAAERLDDVMEITPEIRKSDVNERHGIEEYTDTFLNTVSFNNVTFKYGFQPDVLQNITFSVKRGEKIAVAGNSGCGKSTLLYLLGSLYKPVQGNITVGKHDFVNIPLDILRQHIILVPQKVHLFTGTLEDNLSLAEPGIEKDIMKEIIDGCCLKDIFTNQISGEKIIVDEDGKNFSEGEKQRISIAQALTTNADIMLFDESTSNLDRKTEARILNFLWEFCREKTCFFVAHRQSVIKKCDKVLFLQHGRIAGFDSHENLCKVNQEYRELIGIVQ